MPKLSQVLKQLLVERSRVEQELSRLDAAIGALKGSGAGSVSRRSGKARRVLSVAARNRIAAAQKKRWAKWKAARRNK